MTSSDALSSDDMIAQNPNPVVIINYTDYNRGDYIRFRKNANTPFLYGVITGNSTDTDGGNKRFPFMYHNDRQINTNSDIIDTAVQQAEQFRAPNIENLVNTYLEEMIQNNTLFHFLIYEGSLRMMYDVEVVDTNDINPSIYQILLTAYHNSRNGPPSSTNSSRSTSQSTSRSNSIDYSEFDGVKRYRKIKNKTKRRNKKSKRRRNNRKSKRR